MTFSLDTISMLLDRHRSAESGQPSCADIAMCAAVAMILRQGARGLELLYIQRAHCSSDRWSGNIAFPGGKAKPGESLRETAERETAEEIGLDLAEALYLGRLPEVLGTTLPVRVSCFVYWLPASGAGLALNGEVYDTFWADLDDLMDPPRRITSTVCFDGQVFDTPAIRLAWHGAPVLWGLTYRLTCRFLEICNS